MRDLILVTGATGTVGSELVRQLREVGANFRAALHTPQKGEELRRQGIETAELDWHRPETFGPALEGVTRLFLLTPFLPDQRTVVRKVLDAAREAGVKQIVRLSVMSADHDPGIQIGHWHRQVERMIEESGIPWTFLRPNFFMQNMLRPGTIRDGVIYAPYAKARVSAVDVRDIAAVAVKTLTEGGHTGKKYTLTGPEAISSDDVVAALSEVMGREITYEELPVAVARQHMSEMGMPGVLVDAMLELMRYRHEGHMTDVTHTIEEIAGRPATSFARFARDHRDRLIEVDGGPTTAETGGKPGPGRRG